MKELFSWEGAWIVFLTLSCFAAVYNQWCALGTIEENRDLHEEAGRLREEISECRSDFERVDHINVFLQEQVLQCQQQNRE